MSLNQAVEVSDEMNDMLNVDNNGEITGSNNMSNNSDSFTSYMEMVRQNVVDEDVTYPDFKDSVEIDVDESELNQEEQQELNRIKDRIFRIFLPILYVDRVFDVENDDKETMSKKMDAFVEILAQRYHHEEDLNLPTYGTIGLLAFKRLHKLHNSFDYSSFFEHWVESSDLITFWKSIANDE